MQTVGDGIPVWKILSFTFSLSRNSSFKTFLFAVLLINAVNALQSDRLRNSALFGRTLMIIPVNAPLQFRFNDSDKLKEHMPLPERIPIDLLFWMARRYNFTWKILPTNETTLEKPVSSGNKGSLSYLLDGSCDLVIGNLLMTVGRYQLTDMPYPWIHSQSYFLISKPDVQANFAAILKPFQLLVWLLFVISIIVVVITFQLTSHQNLNQSAVYSSSVIYIVGMLVSQGGPCRSKRIVIRLVAGVWCLACFVLVQAYNSTLITYIIAPNNEPSINSIEDITKNPQINILLEKNMGLESLFLSTTDEKGVFKMIRDRLKGYPNSRCNLQSQCIDLMLSDAQNFVYIKSKSYLLDAMLIDFKKTGICRFQIVKESFMNILISFSLAKNSPYTKSFSEGIIEMNAFGLISFWHKSYMANPYHCLDEKANKKSPNNPRLSLKNLTGAFVVLLVGYATCFIIFTIEHFVVIWRRYRSK